MIPQPPDATQAPCATGAPAGAPVPYGALPGAPPERHCPICGTPLALPWGATASALLDHVILIQDAVRDLKKCLEEMVL